MAETRNAYETLVRNPEGGGGIPSVTRRVRWEDDIKMLTKNWVGFLWLRIRPPGGLM